MIKDCFIDIRLLNERCHLSPSHFFVLLCTSVLQKYRSAAFSSLETSYITREAVRIRDIDCTSRHLWLRVPSFHFLLLNPITFDLRPDTKKWEESMLWEVKGIFLALSFFNFPSILILISMKVEKSVDGRGIGALEVSIVISIGIDIRYVKCLVRSNSEFDSIWLSYKDLNTRKVYYYFVLMK